MARLPNYRAFTGKAQNVLRDSGVALGDDLEDEAESLAYSLAHVAAERIKALEADYGLRNRG